MDEKIIAKYEELKLIVAGYLKRGKTELETFIGEIKVKVKEFSELLEEPEESSEE